MEKRWASREMVSAFADMLCKQAALIKVVPGTVDEGRLNVGTVVLLRAILSPLTILVISLLKDAPNDLPK